MIRRKEKARREYWRRLFAAQCHAAKRYHDILTRYVVRKDGTGFEKKRL